jgi:hypothetical protein
MNKLLILSLSFSLWACAHQSVDRAFDPALCEEGLAYQAGFNDGRDGNNMNSGFAYQCREDLRTGSLKGYKDGYEKGYAEYKQNMEQQRKMMLEMEKNRQKTQTTPAVVVAAPGGPGTYTKWFCEADAFGKKYYGTGTSQFEAKKNARQSCEAGGNHGMHCDDLTCESEVAYYDNRGWYCHITVFNDNFEAYASTRREAREGVQHSCSTKKGDSFFCEKDIVCEIRI